MTDQLCISAFTAVIGLALIAAAFRIWTVRGNLRTLARHHGGRYEPAGRLGTGCAAFDHRGAAVRVCDGSGGPWTARRIDVTFAGGPDPKLNLDIRRQAFLSRFRAGAADPPGDPEFSRRFQVDSDDAFRAASALTPEVRAAVLRLHELSGRREVRVTLQAGRLAVSVAASAYFATDLGYIVGAALTLHARLTSALAGLEPPGAIRIVEVRNGSRPNDDPSAAPAACPVCREPVAERRVSCGNCRTPHHSECWNYAGGCAVYGCRGKRYLRVG